MRGGLAKSELYSSPGKPVLILERPSRVASIEISRDLIIHLSDVNGNPVDQSVVTVEVYDPAGNPVHYYSKNLDIRDGIARIEIPFALNSPLGKWRIKVRDVVSGLTHELEMNR
jgi:hypothetical protein